MVFLYVSTIDILVLEYIVIWYRLLLNDKLDIQVNMQCVTT
jgi:hypothetical protein